MAYDLHELVPQLCAERKALGLKLHDIGKIAGISKENAHRFEKGINSPSLRTLQRYADALGVAIKFTLEEKV